VDTEYAGDDGRVERDRVRESLESAKRRSNEAGVTVAQQVASATEALMSMDSLSLEAEREVLETVCRSLDLMNLLVDDAGRRRQGYPPAALHEAVYMLLEQMNRLRPRLSPPMRPH
jgi:hypothetical protein